MASFPIVIFLFALYLFKVNDSHAVADFRSVEIEFKNGINCTGNVISF